MKICFVGQKHYFDCAVPERLVGHRTEFIDYSWGQNTSSIIEKKNDFDVWFFIRGEYIAEGILRQLSGKKIWISTEPIERADVISGLREGVKKGFDKSFHYDKSHLLKLKSMGINFNGSFQLPVNLDLYKPAGIIEEKYDFCFVGRSTQRREEYMSTLKHLYKFLHVAHGLVGQDYVNTITKAKINLNIHIENYPQLQHRMQNMLACRCFVMSDLLSHNGDLKPYEHYIPFTSVSDLNYTAGKCLLDEDFRNKISQQGYEYVKERFDSVKCWNELIERCI